MKKSLIALAALSAFATAAQAQSSVTVYGIIDVGYASSETKVGAAATKVTNDTIQSGNASTSRLGFRGVEDLGGGTTAEFLAETGLAAANSTTGLFSTNAASGNRQTFVAIKNKALGGISAGYQYTATHNVRIGFDAFAGANTPGNLVAAVSNSNIADSNTVSGNVSIAGTTVTAAAANTATNADYTLRAQSVIYTSPSMNGLTVSVGAIIGDSVSTNSSSVDTPTQNNATTLMARYDAGKLSLAAAYVDQKVKQGARNAAVGDYDVENTTLAGSYNFGPARLFAIYAKDERKYSNATNAGVADVNNENKQLGIQVPVSAKVMLKAAYTDGNYTLGNTGTSGYGLKRDQKGYVLGANYAFSKRTDAYFLYGQQERNVLANTSANKDSAMALGLRHSF
jgi:predicted porin